MPATSSLKLWLRDLIFRHETIDPIEEGAVRRTGSNLRFHDGSRVVSLDRVDSFTKANLPPAGTAGRLARLTDDVRGLWMDQGTQWFSLSGEVVNVKEFGAKGDGVTDDTAAIQQVFNLAADPAVRPLRVWFPRGEYLLTSSITIGNAWGLIVEGVTYVPSDATRGARLRFTSGGFVINTPPAAPYPELTFRNLAIILGPSGGPAFSWPNGGAAPCIERVTIFSANPNQPLIRGRVSMIAHTIRDFVFWMAPGYTQPAIDYSGFIGNLEINNGLIQGRTNGTAPLIRLEGAGSLAAHAANVIRGVIFEAPVAGAVHLFSLHETILERLWMGDLTVDPIAPMIRIAKSETGLPSVRVLIVGCSCFIGTSTQPSVLVEGNVGGQGGVALLGSRFPFVSNNGPGTPVLAINNVGGDFVGDTPLWIDPGSSVDGVASLRIVSELGSPTHTQRTATIRSRRSVSVSTAPVTVYSAATTGAVDNGVLVLVSGTLSGNPNTQFTDLVVYMTNGAATVVSSTVRGTPAARTYSVLGNDLRLAVAAGAYTVSVFATTLAGD
jgi:hypothetical protein